MSNQHPEEDWRNREIEYDPFFFRIAFGLIAIVFAVLVGFALFPQDMGYRSNLYTTAVGVLITVSVLDLLNRRRDARNAEQQLKERLIEDLGSTINEVALRAVEKLSWRGWTEDGTLIGIKLEGANLENASLLDANLQGVSFRNANLKGAFLFGANLDHVDLGEFTEAGAVVLKDLTIDQNKKFQEIIDELDTPENNQKSDLNAKLINILEESINESRAKLHLYDIFKAAKFDEHTVLPDGSLWTPDTDMSQFTHIPRISKSDFEMYVMRTREEWGKHIGNEG